MCDLFGTQAANDRASASAAKAEQDAKDQEAKRQANVTAGNASIDKAFSSYDPAYYDKYKQSYKDAYNPEIDRQYGNAVDQITSSMAGRGLSGGTYSNWSQGEATRTRDDARAKVGGDAENASSSLAGNINQRKTDLFGLNTTANDPEGIAAQATASASSIPAPVPTTSLGQVFSSVLQPISSFQTANMNSIPPYGYGGQSGRAPGSSYRIY
ncbi:MAG: hypothetical protein ABJA10_06695 [Aestuariivirga sp.]